jgi:hypothetical protein
MSSDIEELAREGMRRFTATMQVSPDLAARACQRHRRRARRKLTGLAAGAGAAAAGAVVAVTALAPAAHPATHQPAAQLAAWTVTKLVGGNISVTIRELNDPAGLQATLRADGVPASVRFVPQQNPVCQPYPGGTPEPGLPATPLLKKVFPVPYQGLAGNPLPGAAHAVPVSRPAQARTSNDLHLQHSAGIVIHPAALPGNAGVRIAVSDGGGTSAVLFPGLVYASPRCTGS